jgi:hypothetical protein
MRNGGNGNHKAAGIFGIVLLAKGHDCPLLYIDSDFAITDP